MPGTDKATARAVALIVLLVLAAVALRGYLPGAERAPAEQPVDSGTSLFAVLALLGVSTAILGIAFIASLRNPRRLAAAPAGLPEPLGGKRGRPNWRFVLIGLGVILVWLLIVVLLTRLASQQFIDQFGLGTGSSTVPRSDGPAPPPPSAPPEPDGTVFGYLVATAVILLLLSVAGMFVAARRQRREATSHPLVDAGSELAASASEAESLARAAELGLAEIGDLSREPREAIIACYAAMERGLANAPGAVPQDSDTPSEVLARAVEHHALRADSATELVDLFAEARFSPHVMNEGHREVAVRVLRLVLAELQSVL